MEGQTYWIFAIMVVVVADFLHGWWGLLSGFMGGVLSIWFLMPPSVLAQDEPPKVIEAEGFRVVDDEGNTLATLGASN